MKNSFTLKEATQKLMRFCAYRDRSQKEVEDKLIEMNMIPEAREKIVIHLMQDGFLNEERFARSFVRGKFRMKQWGKVKIIQELRRRAISEPIIRLGLEEIDNTEYRKVLLSVAEKKHKQVQELAYFQKKQKLYSYLISRGFESDLILDLLEDLIPK